MRECVGNGGGSVVVVRDVRCAGAGERIFKSEDQLDLGDAICE